MRIMKSGFIILLLISMTGCFFRKVQSVNSDLERKVAWGIGREKNAQGIPLDALNANEVYKSYGATFVAKEGPIIFLTFDNGYENGNTAKILDTLKENNVPAVFFITGAYAKEEEKLIKRMLNEGHGLGNHSFHHKDYASISKEERVADLMKLHEYVFQNYGYTMHLFRFPKGEFSLSALNDVREREYRTLFWSFAYYDYNIRSQPSDALALKKLVTGLHPGAIYLLHAVSEANMHVLGDFIKEAKRQGYTFGLMV